jgi:mRNA-degrading endonuclease RelE of RelBE toxin-antitoxin system
MPDKNIKFILKLSQKDQLVIKYVLNKILVLDLNWLDIKKLKWNKDLYRCRVWKIRIIFSKIDNKWLVKLIDFRWDIYKNF